MREQIDRLWKLLEIDEDERDDFLSRAGGHAPSSLAKVFDVYQFLFYSESNLLMLY